VDFLVRNDFFMCITASGGWRFGQLPERIALILLP